MKKRLLSTIVSLCLLLTMAPTVAFAAVAELEREYILQRQREGIETADGTVDNPTVIELLSNIVLKSKLVIDENANISIEGNNHIISRSETNWKEADKNIFEVKGNLHMANCTLDAKKAYM